MLGDAKGGGDTTHMRNHLLHQPPVLILIPSAIETDNPARTLQAIARHLQLVHRMNVLHMTLDGRAVGCARYPHVEVFVPTCLEEDGIVAAVQVGEFVEQIQRRSTIQFGVLRERFRTHAQLHPVLSRLTLLGMRQ